MNSIRDFPWERQVNIGLPFRKVAAEPDIDTSIHSKIERNERHVANILKGARKGLERS